MTKMATIKEVQDFLGIVKTVFDDPDYPVYTEEERIRYNNAVKVFNKLSKRYHLNWHIPVTKITKADMEAMNGDDE